MKYFLLCSAVLMLLILGGCRSPFGHVTRTAPGIEYQLGTKGGGGGGIMPAVDGYTESGSSGGRGAVGSYSIQEKYTVMATTPGHFAIQAHYIINLNGVTTVVDKTIPVYSSKPTENKWTKVSPPFTAYAYLTGGTIGY